MKVEVKQYNPKWARGAEVKVLDIFVEGMVVFSIELIREDDGSLYYRCQDEGRFDDEAHLQRYNLEGHIPEVFEAV
jgi:hypothetical protein